MGGCPPEHPPPPPPLPLPSKSLDGACRTCTHVHSTYWRAIPSSWHPQNCTAMVLEGSVVRALRGCVGVGGKDP